MNKKNIKVPGNGIYLLITIGLFLLFFIMNFSFYATSSNMVGNNFSVIENTTRADEYSEWEDIQNIKNQTNRSIPLITIGGVSTLYGEGDPLAVYASITLHGRPVDSLSYTNITITMWNGSNLLFYVNSTSMTKILTGWYYFNWTTPIGSQHHGVYGVLVEADPEGITAQATSGFRIGFVINVSVTLDTASIDEMLDCDGTGDSPICNYTDNLENMTDIIQDMLNCANNANNSDLCNYTQNLESNISDLNSLLLDVNISIWSKLLTIESTVNLINSYAGDINESLDCDSSNNDVCTMVSEIKTLSTEINSTTFKTLGNVTWMLPQVSNILSNVSDVKTYVETLITEFNCTEVNPSDVCYRLELIQNYTSPLEAILLEINTTNYAILARVNTINTTTADIVNRLIEINSTTQNTLTNVTWIVPRINEIITNITNLDTKITTLINEFNCTSINPSDVCYRLQDLASNISAIRIYSESLIDEFNCTSINPSDVCYRLNSIENYAVLIDNKVTEINATTHSILNLVNALNTSIIEELLDCDGVSDSPICSYTVNLQGSVNKVQDMLNCSNLGNNSDLCNYAQRIETNITELMLMMSNHNNTIWNKLLDLETIMNAVNSNTTAIWDALDCDGGSANDVCDYVVEILNLSNEINVSSAESLQNITYVVSQVDTILGNITTIHDYVENLILEFNCTSSNPSDVCYRLELIQNATTGGATSLSEMLREINNTIKETLDMVNYINEVKWGNFSYTAPVPTVLYLQGRIKQISTGNYISIGSVQVNITDAYVSTIMWSNEYDDVINKGVFNIMIGGAVDLSLIPERKYKRDISVCDGITFDPSLYNCETFTTYFIA